MLLNDGNDDPNLLKTAITGDESSEYGYDVETKAQLSQWEPRPKKALTLRDRTERLVCKG